MCVCAWAVARKTEVAEEGWDTGFVDCFAVVILTLYRGSGRLGMLGLGLVIQAALSLGLSSNLIC